MSRATDRELEHRVRPAPSATIASAWHRLGAVTAILGCTCSTSYRMSPDRVAATERPPESSSGTQLDPHGAVGPPRSTLDRAVVAVRAGPFPPPSLSFDPTGVPQDSPSRRNAPTRVLHVSSAGNDGAAGTETAPLRSIRHALELANDTSEAPAHVLVHAGEYREGAPDDAEALHVDREGTVVEAVGGPGGSGDAVRSVVTVRPSGANVRYALLVRASRVVWSGIGFDGFSTSAISIGHESQTLRDIVLTDVRVRMPSGGDGIAVYQDFRDRHVPVIDGLWIERAEVSGADNGFSVGAGPIHSLILRDVRVRNRSQQQGNSGADAIAVENGDNVLIDGADVEGAEGDGIDLKATHAVVANSYVRNVDRNGVKLWFGGDVINTLIHDCGADASIVLVRGATGNAPPLRYRLLHSVVAFHNRSSGAESYVMAVGYDEPAERIALEIINSVFYRNTGAIVVSAGTTTTIRNSLFFGSGNGRVLEYRYRAGADSQYVDQADSPDGLAHAGAASGVPNFATQPSFADVNARTMAGFRPVPGSPLVDRGVPVVPGISVDLTGAVRTGAPDIGVFAAP